MKIVEDLLRNDDGSPLAFKASPNRGGSFAHGLPDTLVVHFTAGRSAESSVRWLTDKRAKASAHVVIGEDGAITQLVPFNVVAWHAGTSKWKAREGLNRYSIGIELDNPGAPGPSGARGSARRSTRTSCSSRRTSTAAQTAAGRSTRPRSWRPRSSSERCWWRRTASKRWWGMTTSHRGARRTPDRHFR
jgi:hypothetical protein